MKRDCRLEAAKWRRLRSWLSDDVKEWRPEDAAFLLIGLDPAETESPAGAQDWGFSWLPGYPAHLGEMDDISRARNIEMALERMSQFVQAADPLAVRSPRQWIAWAEKHGLAPAWLALARARPSMTELVGDVQKPARRTARKVVSDDKKILGWLVDFQRAAMRKAGGKPAKRDDAVTACVAQLECTREAARKAFKALPPDLRNRPGSPGKAAKRQ